jgi:hypothetical protein
MILAGSGLSGRKSAKSGRASGAAFDDLLQQLNHRLLNAAQGLPGADNRRSHAAQPRLVLGAKGRNAPRLQRSPAAHRCESAGEIEQADLGRAQGQTWYGRKSRIDAKIAGSGNHFLQSNIHCKPNCGRVDRTGESLRKSDAPISSAAKILRAPALDVQRPGVDDILRRIALAQCSEIHEELERRSGMTICLDCPVELAIAVVASTYHCDHGAIRTQRNQCGL